MIPGHGVAHSVRCGALSRTRSCWHILGACGEHAEAEISSDADRAKGESMRRIDRLPNIDDVLHLDQWQGLMPLPMFRPML